MNKLLVFILLADTSLRINDVLLIRRDLNISTVAEEMKRFLTSYRRTYNIKMLKHILGYLFNEKKKQAANWLKNDGFKCSRNF